MKVRLLGIILFCAVATSVAQAQSAIRNPKSEIVLPGTPEWDSGFDGQRAWQHVAVLASDSLRGRYSGFAGADKADAYIISQFKQLGLAESFGGDGYRQNFTYGAGEYKAPSSLLFRFPDGRLDTAYMWQEFNIFKYSGFGKAKGRLVFVGYGISALEKGWDDYAGLDVKGAVVLAMRGGPELPGVKWENELYSGFKATTALNKGAAGFMATENDPPKLATIMQEYYQEQMPAVWISKTLADSLLKSTGKTKDEWKKEIDSTRNPHSFPTDVEVEYQVSGNYYPERATDNVAGLIEGSDPELKREVVIIGAHMDHHGTDAAGNIYPGADDNASGTATMMEVARVFAESPVKHKRTLMFMGFAGEEEGLVGSKEFVKRLPLSGFDVVAMLNMDMVGQGNCSLWVGGIADYPVLGEAMFADWPDSVLKALEFGGLYEGSDHYPFGEAGINAYVVGVKGDHPNYHTPLDIAANIKPECLKAAGDMMFRCAAALADWPEPLKPLVNKSEHLLRVNGGIRLDRFDVPNLNFPTPNMWRKFEDRGASKVEEEKERIRRDRQFTMNRHGVKGVTYPEPLKVVTLQHISPSCMRLYQGASEDYFRAVEYIREITSANECHFLADSIRKDYHGKPFVGVTLALQAFDFPEDSLDLNALARAGVGFVNGEVHGKVHLDDWYREETDTRFAGWRGIAEDARRAGMRLWLEKCITNIPRGRLKKGDLYEWWISATTEDSKGIHELAPLWDGQMVCNVTTNGKLPTEALDTLISDGCFLIVNDADYIKRHQNKSTFTQIGIPSDPQFVEELLKEGFRDQEISDLIFGNLQQTLQRWWADTTYTQVELPKVND